MRVTDHKIVGSDAHLVHPSYVKTTFAPGVVRGEYPQYFAPFSSWITHWSVLGSAISLKRRVE